MTIKHLSIILAITAALLPLTIAEQTPTYGPSITVAPIDNQVRQIDNAEVAVVERYKFFEEIEIRDRDFETLLGPGMFSQLIDKSEFFDVVDLDDVKDLINEDEFRDRMTEERFFTLIDIEDLDTIVSRTTFHRDDDITDKRRYVRDHMDETLFEDAINRSEFFTVIDSDDFFDDDVLDREDLMDYVEASNISDKDEYNEDNVIQKLRQRGIFTVIPYYDLFNVVHDFNEFQEAVDEDAFMHQITLDQFVEVLTEQSFWRVVDFSEFMDDIIDMDDLIDELDEYNFFDIIPYNTLLWDTIDTRSFFDTDTIDKEAFFDEVTFEGFFTVISEDTFFNQINTDEFFQREVNDDGFVRFLVPYAGSYEVYTRAQGYYMDHKSVKVGWASDIHLDILLRKGDADTFYPPSDGGGGGGTGGGDDGTGGDGDYGDGGTGDGDNGDQNDTTDNQTTEELIDVDLTKLETPSIVQQGSEYNVSLTVTNRGDNERQVRAVIQSFDTADQTDTFSIEPGTSTSKTLNIIIPSTATGPEEIRATVREGQKIRDEINHKVTVSNVRTYFTVEPPTVQVGSQARINGRITNNDGTAVDTRASLYLGNSYVTNVQPDSQGYFTAYVQPERIGDYQVLLDGPGLFFSRKLTAEGRITIDDFSTASQIVEGEKLETCATITAPAKSTGSIAFSMDNTTLNTRQVTGTSDHCFTVYPAEGERTITLEGTLGGTTTQEQATVSVLPDSTKLRILNSTRHTITAGTNDSIQVPIANPSVSGRQLQATLTDLPYNATTQNKTYYIQGNSTRSITLPLSAQSKGTINATVELDSMDQITTAPITITVTAPGADGTVTAPSWLKKMFDTNYSVFTYLTALALLILILLTGIYAYRRMTGPSYLEPLN